MPDFGNLEDKSIQALVRWLKIRQENGHPIHDAFQLEMDIRKSSLLKWLLNGNEPFDERPPTSYSYPWYELMKTGKGWSNDVWYHENLPGFDCPCLIINQCVWRVVEKVGDEYVCHYGTDSKWRVKYLGRDPAEVTRIGDCQWADRWEIERL